MSKAAFNLLLIVLLVAACFGPLLPNVKATTSTIDFIGPIDEQVGSGTFTYANGTLASCQLIIYASVSGGVIGILELETVSGSSPYTLSYDPATTALVYFDFSIIDDSTTPTTTYHRQYWLTASDDNGLAFGGGDFFICFARTETPINFQIRALGGVSIPTYLEVSSIVNIANAVVKVPLDANNIATVELIPNNIYMITLFSQNTSTIYSFGNVNTYTSPIVLTVSALDFPSSVLQQYKYLRLWASRPSSTEITVSYQDTNLQTVSVVYTINYANGSTAYTATHTSANSFSDTWTSANSNTTYYVEATVIQSAFGTSTFAQVLLRSGTSTSPIDLSFLGPSWPVDPTQIFWAMIVFIVFGCFSVLNAYIGAFAGVATAVIFTWLGWLIIPAGAIVAAFTLVFLVGIVYYKRRGG